MFPEKLVVSIVLQLLVPVLICQEKGDAVYSMMYFEYAYNGVVL
jgi:hypothetical protein